MTETNIDGLRKYFAVVEKPAQVFTLRCNKCPKAWMLDARKGLHPGNVLRLLNHAYGHLKGKKIK